MKLLIILLRNPRRTLVTGGVLLLVLAWFAPALVAHTPLRHWVAGQALHGIQGSVSVGQASLGWLSPVVLQDVAVRDAAGRDVVHIPRLESRKTLLALLADRSDWGGFHCEGPSAHVVFSGQESNVERVFAHWLKPDKAEASSAGPALKLEVVDAKVTILDEDTGRKEQIDSVSLSLTWPGQRPEPMRLEVRGLLADGGRLEAECSLPRAAPSKDTGRLAARFDGLPLGLANPLLRRVAPGAQVEGRLSGRLEGDWALDAGERRANLGGEIAGQGLTLAEPWLGADRLRLERLDVPFRLAVRGSEVQIEHAELRCDLGKATLAGTLNLDGDWTAALSVTASYDLTPLTARLSRFVNLGPLRLAGRGLTRIEIRQGEKDGLAFQIDQDLTDLVLDLSPVPTLREPSVRVQVRGHYDRSADLLRIEQLRIDSQVVGCEGEGRIAALMGSRDLSLGGKVRCDMEKLTVLLRPMIGSGVQITGKEERPFRIEGSLAALTAEAGLAWKSASAYGLQIGPAEVRASLGGGWLRVQPVEANANEGRLRLEPSLRLDPAELHAARGTVLDRVRITPAMCASALGYIAPALAGATEAEGQVSLTLDHARAPLANPSASDVAGKLAIHSARVGPGPLVHELAVLLRAPPNVCAIRESVVPFHLVNGRVHHRDLELIFPELTVRLSGSVGLDGSLALIAEMPIPPKWLGSNRMSAALAKQTVKLPIGGTLDRPKLDEKVLRAASVQFLREAGGEMLRQELEKQLDKLIRPRQ